MKHGILVIILSIYASGLLAETEQAPAATESPRAAALLAGKGMGYAKVAELNGYPGPAHVLELAQAMQLTEHQQEATVKIFNEMQTEAKALGARLVEAEAALEMLFKEKRASETPVSQQLDAIGALEAQLRAVHIKAHIQQQRILTSAQIERYNELRGH